MSIISLEKEHQNDNGRFHVTSQLKVQQKLRIIN